MINLKEEEYAVIVDDGNQGKFQSEEHLRIACIVCMSIEGLLLLHFEILIRSSLFYQKISPYDLIHLHPRWSSEDGPFNPSLSRK